MADSCYRYIQPEKETLPGTQASKYTFSVFSPFSAIYYISRSSWDILRSLLFVKKEEAKMFNNQKFLTRGIESEIPAWLVHLMWHMVLTMEVKIGRASCRERV